MATPLIVNGVTFQYPVQGDKNWGPTLTNWSTAVTSGMLQKAGGTFTLTAEVDFGGSFGMKVLSIKSKETNIAATGFLRLANASTGIVWRNATHDGDLALTVNSSNQLTFNGINVGATTSLTDSHILVGNASNQPADVAMSGDITITNAGVTTLGAGKISNSNINASAAIAVSKLAALTASKLTVTDSSGFLTTQSSPTLTELGYVGGVTSAIQTQLNSITSSYLPLAGGTMSGVLNMGSHKITSVTNGANTGEAATYDQLPGPAGTITNWAALAGMTITGMGTIANSTFLYRRVGDSIQVRGTFTAGTATAVSMSINIPTITIDTAKMATNINSAVGTIYNLTNSLQTLYSTNGAFVLFFDQTDNTKIYAAAQTQTNAFVRMLGTAFTNSTNIAFFFEVPITGWSI